MHREPRLSVIVAEPPTSDDWKRLTALTNREQIELLLVGCQPSMSQGFASVRPVFVRSRANVAARKNAGLHAATGEWVTFFASQDELEPDAWARMLFAAETHKVDAAVCDLCWKDRDMNSTYPLQQDNLYASVVPDAFAGDVIDAAAALAGEDGASVCGKLFRRSLLRKFPFEETLRAYEDSSAVLPALAAAGRVAYVSGHAYTCVHKRSVVERLPKGESTFAAVEALLAALARVTDNSCRQVLVAARLLPALAGLLCDGETLECAARLNDVLDRLISLVPPELLARENPFLARLWQNGAGWEALFSQRVNDWLSQPATKRDTNTLFSIADFHPLVSIVIPVYNGANYMREAIDSALAQTYDQVEVIVVNDGSTDDGETERIARSYGDRIRYFAKPNGGVATALNEGIGTMRGEYFSWLSHDDCYAPRKVENEVRWLALMENRTTLVAEGTRIMDAYGQYRATVHPLYQYHASALRNALYPVLRGAINGCALLIHRSHFQRVGCFDPLYPKTQDYDLWFRMFRAQRLLCTPDANVLTRVHMQQGSASDDAYFAECDELWIRMASSLSDAERAALDGSPEHFWRNLYAFLTDYARRYRGTIVYVARQLGIPEASIPHAEAPLRYQLCHSRSWRLTKPIRAVQYGRKAIDGGLTHRLKWMMVYLYRNEMDRQSDTTIRASNCWRLTAPLRRLAVQLHSRFRNR